MDICRLCPWYLSAPTFCVVPFESAYRICSYNRIDIQTFSFSQHTCKYFRNNPYPTIEEDLLKALKSSGAIAPEWYDKPQLAHFQRASRTDKGVSAVKMVVSLKIGKL